MATGRGAMPADLPEARRLLENLRAGFVEQLPVRLAAIDQCWIDCIQASDPVEPMRELARLSHSLRGSARTYGLMALGDAAAELEAGLEPWRARAVAPDAEARIRLDELVAALHVAARIMPTGVTLSSSPASTADTRIVPVVYLLEADAAEASRLANQVNHFGYRVEVFSSIQSLQAGLERDRPAVCILADETPAGIAAGMAANRLAPGLPLLYASHRDDIESRLGAVRAGGQAYLRKPIDVIELVEELDRVTGRLASAPFRILVVEDDDSLARYYCALLRDAGMASMAVTDPLRTLRALDDFSPDVVLMDVYMPLCSGAELARVIRQRKAHAGLPIVFLSAEGDPDIQYAALRHGGDDFLTKPADADALIRILRVRAQRSRLTATLMIRDGMTGLLNHSRIKEMLVAEVARARRGNTGLAVAMLDLDHLKDINDHHGYLAGDRVIRSLVRLLRERLRGSDLAGRHGGDEFLLLLPGCDLDSGLKLVDDLRDRFAQIAQSGGDVTSMFTTTLSAGVAAFPLANSPEKLIQAAEAALFLAKRQGRNRSR